MTVPATPEEALLALLGGDPAGSAGLDTAGWRKLGAMAEEHRLEPWLSNLWPEPPPDCPPAFPASWRAARRAAALAWLGHLRTQALVQAALDEAAIAALWLKGARLAQLYPAPELRPMRDLDLLVREGELERALGALRALGYRSTEPGRAADWHHLPPLVHDELTPIELHRRLWTASPRQPGDLWERAVRHDGALYPCTAHLAAHCAVHGVISHRLDAGPAMLLDMAMLADAGLDWSRVREAARADGWEAAGALLIALTDRWLRPGLAGRAAFAARVPEDVMAAAPSLLLQPLDQRRRTLMLARHGAAAGPRAKRSPLWLARRLGTLGAALVDPAARGRARRLDRLATFLDG